MLPLSLPAPAAFGAAGLAPPPYVTQSVLQASQPLGPGGFPGSLLGATPFTGGLQPPPPLPGAHLRGLGLGSRVESPPSSHSTSTSAMQRGMSGSVLDEALNLLSYDSAQVRRRPRAPGSASGSAQPLLRSAAGQSPRGPWQEHWICRSPHSHPNPTPLPQVTYVPEEKLVRFSAKLFNCTPAQLPSDLKASLVNMLSCQSMEGYLRPGCVHITGAGCFHRNLPLLREQPAGPFVYLPCFRPVHDVGEPRLVPYGQCSWHA